MLVGGTVAQATASTRVLEGEKLRGGGEIVREPSAARGRALLLPTGNQAASRKIKTGNLGAIIVRARGVAAITVQLDDGTPVELTLTPSWHEHVTRIAVPQGRHQVILRTKRGVARIDRVRLRTTRRKLVPPIEPGAANPGAGGVSSPRRAVPLGTSVVHDHLTGDPQYGSALAREYVSVTPENEMKMETVQPERGKWDFAAADEIVNWASSGGIAVRGHTLVFGKQTPPWVSRLLTVADAERALREHIHTVVNRYKDRVHEWDVVNEAFTEDGKYIDNVWHQKLGDRYVDIAFEAARAADGSARLYYNEFNAETDNRRRGAVVAVAQRLKSKGLIDGIGLQMHTNLAGFPRREELEATMRLYEAMGLDVQITEMDVLAQGDGAPSTFTSRLNQQADVYRIAADACAAVIACKRFTVWGVADRYSWLGSEQIPLLLDYNFAAKPALAAVRGALGG